MLAFGAFCVSCEKDKGPAQAQPPDCSAYQTHLSADIQKVNFKPGTYWVLYDSIANKYDSVAVAYNQQFVQEYNWNMSPRCLKTADVVQHLLNEYTYTAGGTPTLTSVGEFGIMKCLDSHVLLQKLSEINCANYNNCGTSVYYDYEAAGNAPEAQFITRYDSFFVYNTWFKKVMKTSYPLNYVPGYGKREYLFNTEVGFLKLKLYDNGGTLNYNAVLVRQHLVK